MSSSISRGKPAAWAPALTFRSIQGIAKSSNAREDRATQPARQTDSECEHKVRAAYEQGLQEGRSVADRLAAARAQELIRPTLDGFRAITEDLAHSKSRLRGEAEEDVVKLALAISRRVLHRELSTDPEALLGLVRAAWDRVDGRETHRLRLSPEDAEIVRENRSDLNLPPRLEIDADPSLVRGSAFFETSRGTLDASISTQLGEIERGLTDVLLRHKAGA